MNIIICGAGRVGFTIAKLLTEQNHSITVIDQSSEDIQKINDTLDVKAIVGKATSPLILENANSKEADMIIAVTRNDEINMMICQIAHSLFKVPKKIARIRSQDYLNPKFSKLYNKENLPIDVIISPDNIISTDFDLPIILGNRCVAPSQGKNPLLICFKPNTLSIVQILMSPLNAISKRLSNMYPSITTITGHWILSTFDASL